MKLKLNIFTVIAASVLALAVPFVIYFARAPVLIVTDQAIIPLYGEARIRRETFSASLSLFRPVHNIFVADDAGDDIVQFAIADVSLRPFCVLFPHRFARSARLYSEQRPQVRVVVLEGRYGELFPESGGNFNGFFTYKTDIEADFFTAGLAAGALHSGNGRIAVFLEPRIAEAGSFFMQAVNSQENPPETSFFTSFSQYSGISGLSCVVLAGQGAEFLEDSNGIPVILFSWIDPSLAPANVILIINDSPWAQAVQAVKMAAAGIDPGRIRSKLIILNDKIIGKRALKQA